MAPQQKKYSAKPKGPVAREYTINLHKRIHGMYVLASRGLRCLCAVSVGENEFLASARVKPASHVCGMARWACSGFKKRAPRAIKAVKEFAKKEMGTSDVRIDTALNKHLWSQGIRVRSGRGMWPVAGTVLDSIGLTVVPQQNVPFRVRVLLERKVNEDEHAKEKLYTLVTHVPCSNFHGTQTKNVN